MEYTKLSPVHALRIYALVSIDYRGRNENNGFNA